MHAFRKNILVLLITSVGVLGLLNVSVQFANIVDLFPNLNISLLLAEEITETEGNTEKGTENFSLSELILSHESHDLNILFTTTATSLIIHAVELPVHPDFERVTPPPKA
jgi:hypothetical protein